MTDGNVKKLKKWLNLQVKAQRNRELVMISEKFRVTNLCYYSDSIHISSNVEEIAKILDLEVECGEFDDEYTVKSFIYDGVRFFTLNKIEGGETDD